MSESFLSGKVTLRTGNCSEVVEAMPDNSVDSVVCDPPYALVSITKRFGKPGSAPAKDVYGRGAAGFMGKQWDTGDVAFDPAFWAEVLRITKPGGHVVAFSSTRTYHRLACAIEDAGWEIRDQIAWCYGSGFPKSHDVSKGIDKAAGAEREVVSERPAYGIGGNGVLGGHAEGATAKITIAATEQAHAWTGWGTALKPAWEPICLARKPLVGTVAANVLRHGTGAINVDGCRVGTDGGTKTIAGDRHAKTVNAYGDGLGVQGGSIASIDAGRWPANLIHDGSPEVLAAFPEPHGAGAARSGQFGGEYAATSYDMGGAREMGRFGDEGSAARFFYTAKADADDRLGFKHPTIKPVDLMQWLVRLVTPRGGLVLDPFAGTGTTGEAAWREGMRAVLIEREPEYQDYIRRRMHLAERPAERTATAKSKGVVADAGPLFGDFA